MYWGGGANCASFVGIMLETWFLPASLVPLHIGVGRLLSAVVVHIADWRVRVQHQDMEDFFGL